MNFQTQKKNSRIIATIKKLGEIQKKIKKKGSKHLLS